MSDNIRACSCKLAHAIASAESLSATAAACSVVSVVTNADVGVQDLLQMFAVTIID